MKNGFSLIEVFVVLCIVAIMSSIAIPTYLNHLQKTRRLEAKTALFRLATYLEKYAIEHGSYESITINKTHSSGGWYILTISSLTPTSYSLSATPRLAQAKDRLCQTFTLNSLGVKGIAEGPIGIPSGTVKVCW
jgi:type IV pilus assembly protein PilE